MKLFRLFMYFISMNIFQYDNVYSQYCVWGHDVIYRLMLMICYGLSNLCRYSRRY